MTAQYQFTRKDNNKKKIIAILFCLVLAAVLVVGSLFAFFSDIFTNTKNATAGTLDLEGSAAFYINSSSSAASESDLKCLNPGDSIKVVIDVENTGSKSAWIQGSFSLSAAGLSGAQLGNAFTVYEGANTSGTPLTMVTDTNSISFTDDGKAILDGSAEPESAPGALGGASTSMIYTIIFEPSANNDFQDVTISIGYAVKALQYRNNPFPNWASAVKLGA